MRLHVFDAFIGSKHFRGLAFNKRAEKLKREMTLQSHDITIAPSDWTYWGQTVVHDDGTTLRKHLMSNMKSRGFAVLQLPDPPTKFYVYDVEFDLGKYRVYSADKSLKEFKLFRNSLELAVQGDKWKGEGEKLIGDVNVRNAAEATALGITDYPGLVIRRFDMKLVQANSNRHVLEKKVLRHLREEMSQYGVHIEDFRIDDVRIASREMPTDSACESVGRPAAGEVTNLRPQPDIIGTQPGNNALHLGTPLIMTVLRLSAAIGALVIFASLAFVMLGDGTGSTELTLFGNKISTTSVGIAGIFIGAVPVITLFIRSLSTIERLSGAERDKSDT